MSWTGAVRNGKGRGRGVAILDIFCDTERSSEGKNRQIADFIFYNLQLFSKRIAGGRTIGGVRLRMLG